MRPDLRISQCCHQQKFLVKFARDRWRYLAAVTKESKAMKKSDATQLKTLEIDTFETPRF